MSKLTAKFWLWALVPFITCLLFGIILTAVLFEPMTILFVLAPILACIGVFVGSKESTVTITLTKTGKIEETGNVLKK